MTLSMLLFEARSSHFVEVRAAGLAVNLYKTPTELSDQGQMGLRKHPTPVR
jgi:hypothetical protein